MELDLNKATSTTLATTVSDYAVTQVSPDSPRDQDETYYDITDFTKWWGYYKKHPDLKSAIDSLAIWATGLGYETDDITRATLKMVTGWGNDSFDDILFNLFVMKKIAGDSFAEIITHNGKAISEGGKLINIKPLNPEFVRIVANRKGKIIRYEYRTVSKDSENKKFKPNQILHLCNERVGDEIHGQSVPESVEDEIATIKEIMQDIRRVLHRSTIRVMYIDSEDTTKLNHIKSEYSSAISTGELMLIPAKKGEAEFQDLPAINMDSHMKHLDKLNNRFYEVVKIPRVIATSENYTEAGSKVGFLTFEPIYTHEQVLLENDLAKQLGIVLKFNRPPSLSGMMQQSEQANTGQTNFQPSELNPRTQT